MESKLKNVLGGMRARVKPHNPVQVTIPQDLSKKSHMLKDILMKLMERHNTTGIPMSYVGGELSRFGFKNIRSLVEGCSAVIHLEGENVCLNQSQFHRKYLPGFL